MGCTLDRAGCFARERLFTDAEILPYRYANAPNGMAFNELIKRVMRHVDRRTCLRIAVVAPTVTGDTQGQAWRQASARHRYGPMTATASARSRCGFNLGLRFRHRGWCRSWIRPANGGLVEVCDCREHGRQQPARDGREQQQHLARPDEQAAPGAQLPDLLPPQRRLHQRRAVRGFDSWRHPEDINLSPGWDKGPQVADYRDRYCAYLDPRGCPLWPTDVWIRFRWRIHVATYGGTAGNECDLLVVDGRRFVVDLASVAPKLLGGSGDNPWTLDSTRSG